MPADDLLADRETEAGASNGLSGGEEGFEYAFKVLLGNAGPGVVNEYVERVARVFLDRQREGPLLAAGFRHGVDRVDHQVGEHLAEFRLVPGHPDLAARTEADLELDAGVGEPLRQCVATFLDH